MSQFRLGIVPRFTLQLRQGPSRAGLCYQIYGILKIVSVIETTSSHENLIWDSKPFYFNPNYGLQTPSKPPEAGMAIRSEVVLHSPALIETRNIHKKSCRLAKRKRLLNHCLTARHYRIDYPQISCFKNHYLLTTAQNIGLWFNCTHEPRLIASDLFGQAPSCPSFSPHSLRISCRFCHQPLLPSF